MKYYLILFAFLILLSLQISVTYFLWDLDKNVPLKGLLIFELLLFLHIFYKHLTNYSKIERIKNELTIQTFFSKRKYNLTNLTS